VVVEGVFQGIDAHAAERGCRDFEDLQLQILHDLEEIEIDGGLDRHRITGPAQGAQGQHHRLHATRGDEDLIVVQGAAGDQHALGDLLAQPLAAGRYFIGDGGEGETAGFRGQHPVQFVHRQQVGVGKGDAQLHQSRVEEVVHHHPEDAADADLGGVDGGRVDHRLFRRGREPGADVIAGLGTGAQEEAVLQQGVGLLDGIEADAELAAQLADRGHPVAGPEGALFHQGGDLAGDLFVKGRSRRFFAFHRAHGGSLVLERKKGQIQLPERMMVTDFENINCNGYKSKLLYLFVNLF
jgi:hypothetical protein